MKRIYLFSVLMLVAALTPAVVLASDYSGSSTGAELDYVHGVTSGIQTQINGVAATANAALPATNKAVGLTTPYYPAEYSNGTCTTSATLSSANGVRQSLALTNADTCALTFTQPPGGQTAVFGVKIIQSASGSFNGTISGCKWPGGTVPTITATSGATDFISVYLDGTTAWCATAQAFQ